MRVATISAVAIIAVHGVGSAKPENKAKVEPKADALLRQMSDSLAKTKSFQFDANHTLEVVTKEGERLQFVAGSRVSIQRPNKARSERLGAIADVTFYYDGKQITIFGKKRNMFATAPAPATLDEALDFARDKLQVEAPAADLLYSDAYAGLMSEVISGRYVGLEPIEDRQCHHLAFRAKETDWQIWVEDSPQALPCRYVIVSKLEQGKPEFSVAFSNWDTGAELATSLFEFKAPEGATRIEFLGLQDLKTKQGAKP